VSADTARGARFAQRLLAGAALALGVACGDEPAPPAAPTAPRAKLVLEPAEVGIGGVARVELAVVTPPDHHARPFETPPEVPGFWLLDAEALPVEKYPERWLHRTRIRIRAREVGRFVWPEGSVAIESPDGELATLPVGALPLEVTSVRPELPDRLTPFGARSLPAPGAGASRWGAGAGGAVLALAGVALVALARRRLRRRPRTDPRPLPPSETPWVRAARELRGARASIAGDPIAAAHLVAIALRRYMAGRFGADAVARTTEELDATPPPFAATSRWPALLSILRGLDEFRFRPEGETEAGAALSARVEALLADADALVEDTIPPEARS
jgi:hypothetical protein